MAKKSGYSGIGGAEGTRLTLGGTNQGKGQSSRRPATKLATIEVHCVEDESSLEAKFLEMSELAARFPPLETTLADKEKLPQARWNIKAASAQVAELEHLANFEHLLHLAFTQEGELCPSLICGICE